MKKIFLTASLVLSGLALACPSFAQSPVTLGPKIGVNVTNFLSDDHRLTENAVLGYVGGLFVRVNLGKAYIQPEGYFTSKGSNLAFRPDPNDPHSGEANGKVRLTSLDVPLLLGVKLIDAKAFNLRLMGGPVASFVLKENRNDLSLFESQSYTYNRSNIGFQAGLGFDIGNVTFDARYEGGLNHINKTFNQRTSLFQFSVGFKLF